MTHPFAGYAAPQSRPILPIELGPNPSLAGAAPSRRDATCRSQNIARRQIAAEKRGYINFTINVRELLQATCRKTLTQVSSACGRHNEHFEIYWTYLDSATACSDKLVGGYLSLQVYFAVIPPN